MHTHVLMHLELRGCVHRCNRQPAFGFPSQEGTPSAEARAGNMRKAWGSGGRFCRDHRLPGMLRARARVYVCVCVCVCVRAARLAPVINCCSIWQESVQEVKTGLARGHTERTGMVNVKNRRCLHPNCTKQPLFGPPPHSAVRGDPGAGCVSHGVSQGKQARKTEVADPPKTTSAGSFGSQAAGRRRASKAREPRQQGAIYCAEHKLEGYIDVKHRRCRGPVSLSDALANIPPQDSATGPNATGVFEIGAGDAGGQGAQRGACQRQPTFGPPGFSCPC